MRELFQVLDREDRISILKLLSLLIKESNKTTYNDNSDWILAFNEAGFRTDDININEILSTIAKLEENVQKIQSVTTLIEQGHTPESLLEQVLDGFDIEINDTIPTEFYCNCSKSRVERALISIGRKELNELIQDGKDVELNCHFCNQNYVFSVEELKEILRKCK